MHTKFKATEVLRTLRSITQATQFTGMFTDPKRTSEQAWLANATPQYSPANEPSLSKFAAATSPESDAPKSQIRPTARSEHAPETTHPTNATTATTTCRRTTKSTNCNANESTSNTLSNRRYLSTIPTITSTNDTIPNWLTKHIPTKSRRESSRPRSLLSLRSESYQVHWRTSSIHETGSWNRKSRERIPTKKFGQVYRESCIPTAIVLRRRSKFERRPEKRWQGWR